MKLPVSETLIHEGIIALLRFKAKRGVLYWHVPNGGWRAKRTAAAMKRLGALAGVPDIHLLLPGAVSAFLEVKGPQGRLSPEQRAFWDAAQELGALYAIVRSVDEAERVLSAWGCLRGSSSLPEGHAREAA